MAKSASRLSDVLENELSNAIWQAVGGLALIFLVSPLAFYIMRQFAGGIMLGYWLFLVIGVATLVCGVVITYKAIRRGVQAKQSPTVPFTCPYCDKVNLFLEAPTDDFTCEGCDRQVHFENGVMVPVRTIICQACRAEHRVAINVLRYVCDRCNRPLRLGDGKVAAQADGSDSGDALLRNYDVLLIAIDHRRESEVAFKVQNLLVVNMNEARRLMSTASSSTPLIVGHNLPERKAESIRRQLQEMGATATLRPTATGTSPTQGARGAR